MRRTEKILLVDDNELILETLSDIIRSEGYSVSVADNGEDAIKLMGNNNFNLVITDLVMKPLDGLAVLKKSKEIDPELMVIILTGYGDMKTAIEALRLEADDYLLKPCEEEELFIKISRLLEKQSIRRSIKLYENILPICCVCKQIRDDAGKEKGTGKWMSLEDYVSKRGIRPTHTYCKKCAKIILEEN